MKGWLRVEVGQDLLDRWDEYASEVRLVASEGAKASSATLLDDDPVLSVVDGRHFVDFAIERP